MREIPWFRPYRPSSTPDARQRPSARLEAYLNEMDESAGSGLFTRFATILRGYVEWADDPDMPAPYRVVRGWQGK